MSGSIVILINFARLRSKVSIIAKNLLSFGGLRILAQEQLHGLPPLRQAVGRWR